MIGVLKQYNGDSLYLALYVACIVICGYQAWKRGEETGKKITAASALAVIFIFNDAALLLVGKLTDDTTYYRFFWMLPVLFLPAYFFTEGFLSGEKKRAAFCAAALVVCLLAGGNFFIRSENLSRPQNLYGLSQDAIVMADAMMEDWELSKLTAGYRGAAEKAHVDGPVAAFDMYLEYQVRTYEPRITWAVGRKAYLYQAKEGYDYRKGKYRRQQRIIAAVNEGRKEDVKALRRSLDGLDADYLVIQSAFDMDGYLAQAQIVPVCSGEVYTLYKVLK